MTHFPRVCVCALRKSLCEVWSDDDGAVVLNGSYNLMVNGDL